LPTVTRSITASKRRTRVPCVGLVLVLASHIVGADVVTVVS
jgi:hypothetical protein